MITVKVADKIVAKAYVGSKVKVKTSIRGPYILNIDSDMIAIGIQPTGTIDGANKEFTLPDNYSVGTLQVYLNSARQTHGATNDYVEQLPNKFIFADAPQPGDIIICDYIKL